ncbi:MAG: SIMPL domain-containing protein [Sphaerochaetaceae bacterium]|nr:SIMPL domain-containing protein [Sphaerochaetaceae bacterium]
MKRYVQMTALAAAVFILLFSCSTVSVVEKNKTVSVTGNATLMITPDSASFTVRSSELAKTTKEAQHLVNSKINTILNKLEALGVDKKNIQTNTYDFSPEYQYIENKRELVGQRVSQSISVILHDIDTDGQLLPSILDSLGEVTNISLSSIEFFKEDMSGIYDEARIKAFEDALKKGSMYAEAADLTLSDALVISDYSSAGYVGTARAEMAKSMMMADSAPTQLPVSTISVSHSGTVTFALK